MLFEWIRPKWSTRFKLARSEELASEQQLSKYGTVNQKFSIVMQEVSRRSSKNDDDDTADWLSDACEWAKNLLSRRIEAASALGR